MSWVKSNVITFTPRQRDISWMLCSLAEGQKQLLCFKWQGRKTHEETDTWTSVWQIRMTHQQEDPKQKFKKIKTLIEIFLMWYVWVNIKVNPNVNDALIKEGEINHIEYLRSEIGVEKGA